MKKFIRTAGMIIAGTLTAGSPVTGFAEDPVVTPAPTCDVCDYYSAMSSNLSKISQDISAIKDSIVGSAADAGSGYSDFIAAYKSSNDFEQGADSIAKDESNDISKEFLDVSGQSAESNQESAYKNLQVSQSADYSNISASSLFSARSVGNSRLHLYDSDQEKAAKDYIRFLSGNLVPATKGDTSTDGGKKMMNVYNTLAAAQSMNAFALSKIYSERARIDKPKSLDDILSGDDVSASALLDYIYRDKVLKEDWLTSIGSDVPLTLSRKTVYLLVGVFTALYRIEQNQELQIATQAANNTLQMLNLQAIKDNAPTDGQNPGDAASSQANEAESGGLSDASAADEKEPAGNSTGSTP